MKKLVVGIILSLLLIAIIVVPVVAGGPHDKATGTVTWTARTHLDPEWQIPGIVSSFAVHDNAPGEKAERGFHELYRPPDTNYGFPGGSLTLDADCVNVDDDETWFAGHVVSASGGYAGLIGDIFLYWVHDNATPGAGGDLIGGIGYQTLGEACADVYSGGWTGTGVVTDGNLRVHYYD